MSYLSPTVDNDGLFSISKIEFNVDEVDETMFLYGFPENTVIIMDGIEIPCEIFDYYNPFIVSPDFKKVKLYRVGETKPLNKIECWCLKVKNKNYVKSIIYNTIYYPPTFDVDYFNSKVYLASQGKQICHLFDMIESKAQIRVANTASDTDNTNGFENSIQQVIRILDHNLYNAMLQYTEEESGIYDSDEEIQVEWT